MSLEMEDIPRESGHLRMVEALLFAATEPLDLETLAERLPDGADIPALLARLGEMYEGRGVTLVETGGRWSFRTAPDLAFLLRREVETQRRLSRAAIETLAIIAYHQPVTRGEIEEVRGVGLSRGTLDVLMEAGWVRIKGRRRTPGRPVTYGTSDAFLDHFGLNAIDDLPGLEELKSAGFLDSTDSADLSRFGLPGDDEEEAEDNDEGPLAPGLEEAGEAEACEGEGLADQ